MNDKGMQIDPSALSGHAAKVAEISTNVGTSGNALTYTGLNGQAFGDLCSFLVSPFEMAKKEADAAISASAAAIDLTVSDLRTTANTYESADVEATRTFRKLDDLLGSNDLLGGNNG
mgnify:FL=1